LTVDEWHYCTGTVITQLQRIHTTKSGTVAAPAHRLKPCSEPPPSPHHVAAASTPTSCCHRRAQKLQRRPIRSSCDRSSPFIFLVVDTARDDRIGPVLVRGDDIGRERGQRQMWVAPSATAVGACWTVARARGRPELPRQRPERTMGRVSSGGWHSSGWSTSSMVNTEAR
jgi:hypothetical protein